MSTDTAVIHTEEATPSLSMTYVVGIGASAGGLEALERVFKHMPADSGMAYVVVQHLSPDFKSLMNELLARHTRIPIHQVEDGMVVEPNSIYLIPPKKEMIISNGKLHLSDKDEAKEFALPIDLFLRSLAQDVGPRAIAVILSGSGSDGSRGIRDIRDSGGFVVCQSESSAKFDGMPKSARDSGCVDIVADPEDIPRVLSEYAQGLGVRQAQELSRLDGVRPRGLGAVFAMLQQEFGIDFSHYKPTTVSRRIERRLQLNRSSTLDDYVTRIAESPEERNALYKDLLIGVTRFFRDSEAFEAIDRIVLPEILRGLGPEDEFRVWCAGCATGEEAYSIAMLLQERLNDMDAPPRLKIFATDVHRASLEFAATGIYDEESVAEVPPDRLARFFSRHGSGWRVSPDLRQHVVFAPHNVLKDAPFTKVHLLTCRNMLIYLQPHAQKKVLSLFHFALRRGGVMFLGPSETPSSLGEDFETLDEHARLYRKQRDLRLPIEARMPLPKPTGIRTSGAVASMPLMQVMSTYDVLLDEYLPPSLLVNERRELIHAFRGAGKFLRLKDGRPSLDVLDMVDPELKRALTGAVQRATKELSPVVYKGVRVATDNEDAVVRLTVKPIINRSASANYLLISLEEETDVIPPRPEETVIEVGQVTREQLIALESELRYTKENLQATIEELETSNEELQATNEELVASNEELQSTNEELQSVNEELYTVNAEYQKKISELTELTADMDNLLLSTEVGTIFLDRDFCIRKYTPKIADMFNLIPQDVGRRIEVFANTLAQDGLLGDLISVRDSGQTIEREVRDRNGDWFYLRILPYRAKGEIGGVVLTLIDITNLKQAQDALFAERYLLESVMETLPDLIYFKDSQGRYIRINSSMASRLGLEKASLAIGKHASSFFPPAAVERELAEEKQIIASGRGHTNSEEPMMDADGSERWMMTSRMPLHDRAGVIVGTFGVARDITERRRSEEEVREAVRRRDHFLAMLSHELRNPLGAIVSASYVLQDPDMPKNVKDRASHTIERQSKQMARLLDDLLDVSRVTQNKIELKRQALDLRSVIQDALEDVKGRMEEKKLNLTVDVGETPLYVDGDAARLQQIHVNLLNNACKFSPVGSSVTVTARVQGEEVVTRVRDTGVGIAKEMLEKVFELFVQSENKLDRSEAGMGVGLTLVRSLVELHGGSVLAHSDGAGMGSEFVVRLPIAREPTARRRKRPELRMKAAGAKVVLVEDNDDSREMMRVLMESMGFEVQTAANGADGIAMISSVVPDVALVDIGLPGTDGYHVAAHIRSVRGLEHVYLIALTGYGQPSDRQLALEAGFDEHLVKPLSLQKLNAVLRGADVGVEQELPN